MSGVPESRSENVQSLASWLGEALQEIEALASRIHEIRDQLKERLYAIKASENPRIQERVEEIIRLRASGGLVETMTADDIEREMLSR